LFSPDWYSLDVFVHPKLRGTPLGESIWLKAEQISISQHLKAGRQKLCTLWIAENDDWTVGHLEGRGFRPTEEFMHVMVHPLTGPVGKPVLPDGYEIRPARDRSEAGMRARSQHAAFESSLPIDVYIDRYARFMGSPGYPAGFDIMVIPPHESKQHLEISSAAFTITWPDPVNRVGLFEPVGVHPDYHRRGLGDRRVAALAGLRYGECDGVRSEQPARGTSFLRKPGLSPNLDPPDIRERNLTAG
jgi:GNAT superfamily N-acetyltransferase